MENLINNVKQIVHETILEGTESEIFDTLAKIVNHIKLNISDVEIEKKMQDCICHGIKFEWVYIKPRISVDKTSITFRVGGKFA